MPVLEIVGCWLAQYLSRPREGGVHVATSRPAALLASTLRKGDVLLVEGTSRFSVTIKYLTQSTWSHAAVFIGDAMGPPKAGEKARILVEADVYEGVVGICSSHNTVRFAYYWRLINWNGSMEPINTSI